MKEDDLSGIKSLSQAARKFLGVGYYNGRVKKELIEYFGVYGIDILDIVRRNRTHTVKCKCCGNEFTPKYEGNIFCSSSCAASFNNKNRTRSEESKRKTSESLYKYYHGDEWKEYADKSVLNTVCKVCGREYHSKRGGTGYCSLGCRSEDPEYRDKLRAAQIKLVQNGKHKGWQTRNVESYPEKFWKTVLDNNGIEYLREDFSTKKYFLDFLIEKNGTKIDLEIDGKQHSRRIEHDKKRDEFLTENGFVVYRIKWNSINSKEGSEKMKKKIEDFIEFYNKI